MVVRLIHIGNAFYHQSGTVMSSLYTEDGLRYDWGLVDRAVERGDRVEIRPATHAERVHYQRELSRLLKKWECS